MFTDFFSIYFLFFKASTRGEREVGWASSKSESSSWICGSCQYLVSVGQSSSDVTQDDPVHLHHHRTPTTRSSGAFNHTHDSHAGKENSDHMHTSMLMYVYPPVVLLDQFFFRSYSWELDQESSLWMLDVLLGWQHDCTQRQLPWMCRTCQGRYWSLPSILIRARNLSSLFVTPKKT